MTAAPRTHAIHAHEAKGPGRALAAGLVLTLAFAALEVGAGLASGSLALIADAGHMLVDSAGLVLALVATLISRRPSDVRRTYGYARAEVLIVPLHVVLMLGLAGYIVYEAISRLDGAPDVAGLPVLAVGIVGLAVNIVVLRLLQGHGHTNLNARGAALEVSMDALGSIGVIISAIVVLTTGWGGADVIVSLVIGALVVPRVVILLRQVLGILLEGTPPGLDIRALETDALEVAGVRALHDLHVWSLTPSFTALSAHVEVDSMDGCGQPIASLTKMFRDRHGIIHVTLQPETAELHNEIDCCLYPDAVRFEHEHVH